MVRPGDEIPARKGGHGHLRASHADRERVIDTLKAAYVYGLVTKDEFDERASQTFAARTYAELALITADIPAGLAAAPSPLRPAPAEANLPVSAHLGAGERAVVAAAVLAGLAFIAALFAGNPVAGLLALGGTGSALVSLFLAGGQILSSRRPLTMNDQG
jgi:anti-sigma factor RsiW